MKAYKVLRRGPGDYYLRSYALGHALARRYREGEDTYFPNCPAFCFKSAPAARNFLTLQAGPSYFGCELWEVDIDPAPTPEKILHPGRLCEDHIHRFWQNKDHQVYMADPLWTIPIPKDTICATRVRLIRQVISCHLDTADRADQPTEGESS